MGIRESGTNIFNALILHYGWELAIIVPKNGFLWGILVHLHMGCTEKGLKYTNTIDGPL